MRSYLMEVVGEGRLDLIERIAHENMVDEANLAFGGPTGRAGLVAHVKGFRRNVHDLDIEIRRIVAETNHVMAWWSFTGILAGPWFNRPVTNERFDGNVFSFFELDEGLVRRYSLWLHATLDPPIVFDSSRP